MADLDLTLIIIGKICSGKSTLAKDFSKWLHFPIASFGSYLTDYSKKNNLQTDRESLQDLGHKFISENHSLFLHNVIKNTTDMPKNLIFEGVRHKVILDEIKNTSRMSFSIFLDAKEEVRLQRFIKREKDMDKNNAEDDFYSRSNHKVELEVDSLKEYCNFIITTNDSYQDFLKALSLYR